MSPAFSRRPRVAAPAASGTTADVLGTLGAPFTVRHDIPLPGTRATIDHVVVGPAGLFVVEVRTYRWPIRSRRGQLRSGDFPLQGVLEMVSWKAERLQAELGVPGSPSPRPTPVLCVEGAVLPRGMTEVNGVRVVDPARLGPALGGDPLLDAMKIRQIEDRLRLMASKER